MIVYLLKKMMSRYGHKTFVHTIEIIICILSGHESPLLFLLLPVPWGWADRVVILTPNNHEGTSNASTN